MKLHTAAQSEISFLQMQLQIFLSVISSISLMKIL